MVEQKNNRGSCAESLKLLQKINANIERNKKYLLENIYIQSDQKNKQSF